MQAGTSFTHRRRAGGGLAERSVSCARDDRHWVFHACGEPLPEEDVACYAARRKRDRLDEGRMIHLGSGVEPGNSAARGRGRRRRSSSGGWPAG